MCVIAVSKIRSLVVIRQFCNKTFYYSPENSIKLPNIQFTVGKYFMDNSLK